MWLSKRQSVTQHRGAHHVGVGARLAVGPEIQRRHELIDRQRERCVHRHVERVRLAVRLELPEGHEVDGEGGDERDRRRHRREELKEVERRRAERDVERRVDGGREAEEGLRARRRLSGL